MVIKTCYKLVFSGGRTVAELTQVCMQLASNKNRDDDSDSDASPINKPIGSDDEAEEPFIRHPFQVKDAPLKSIVMNIKVSRGCLKKEWCSKLPIF